MMFGIFLTFELSLWLYFHIIRSIHNCDEQVPLTVHNIILDDIRCSVVGNGHLCIRDIMHSKEVKCVLEMLDR